MVDVLLDRLFDFQELLDSLSPVELAAAVAGLFALLFVLILVHELGHAAVALARTDALVLVQ